MLKENAIDIYNAQIKNLKNITNLENANFQTFVSLVILITGFILALIAPKIIALSFMGLSALLTLAIFCMLLFLPKDTFARIHRVGFKVFIPMLIVQTVFIALAFIFFHTFENISQLNPRIQALETGTIIKVLKDNIFTLGILPWCLYGALGVAFAYFSFYLKKGVTFPVIIFPFTKSSAELFFHFYIVSVLYTLSLFPILFTTTLALIWLTEGIALWFHWPSIFVNPYRTLFICALLMFFFLRMNNRFLEALKAKGVPLGGIIGLYVVIISFFLLWMHGFAVWFLEGLQQFDPTLKMKSFMAGSFTEGEQNIRISLLIWGFFGCFIPWMTSFIARMCLAFCQRPFISAILCCFYPALVFYCLGQYFTQEHWVMLDTFLKDPSVKISVAVLLILFIMMMWGKTHTSADLERGALYPMGPMRSRPLTKWLRVFFMTLGSFLLGIILLGWLPAQVVGTLATGFILTVVTGFTVRLFISIKSKESPQLIVQ